MENIIIEFYLEAMQTEKKFVGSSVGIAKKLFLNYNGIKELSMFILKAGKKFIGLILDDKMRYQFHLVAKQEQAFKFKTKELAEEKANLLKEQKVAKTITVKPAS